MNPTTAAFSAEFHDYFFRRSRWLLAAGFLFLGLNYLLSDIDHTRIFGLAAEIPVSVRWAERGVIIPLSFTIAALLAVWGERRWMQHVVVYGALIVGCAVILGRRLWQLEGGDFPSDYSLYIPCALAALTAMGPRIWVVTAPMLLLNLGSAYYVHGFSPAANFEVPTILSAALVVAAINWQVRHVVQLVWGERRAFEDLSQKDPLTGLYNRRAFEARVNAALAQARRDGISVALAMVDLDHFKAYNDQYGHAAGDDALRETAAVLAAQAQRPLDIAARLGGEEFVCFWYDVTPEGAEQLAATTLAGIQALKIAHPRSPVVPVLTASAGLRVAIPEGPTALSDLLLAADTLLYTAKSTGRNTVMMSVANARDRRAMPAAGAERAR